MKPFHEIHSFRADRQQLSDAINRAKREVEAFRKMFNERPVEVCDETDEIARKEKAQK